MHDFASAKEVECVLLRPTFGADPTPPNRDLRIRIISSVIVYMCDCTYILLSYSKVEDKTSLCRLHQCVSSNIPSIWSHMSSAHNRDAVPISRVFSSS